MRNWESKLQKIGVLQQNLRMYNLGNEILIQVKMIATNYNNLEMNVESYQYFMQLCLNKETMLYIGIPCF